MIFKSGKIAICVFCAVPLASCIQIKVNPEGVVEDTVAAGKSLYQTIKRKKDGTEERLYTHTVPLQANTIKTADLADSNAQQAGEACLAYLTQTVNAAAKEAAEKEAGIVEASTEEIDTDSGKKVKCSMLVVL